MLYLNIIAVLRIRLVYFLWPVTIFMVRSVKTYGESNSIIDCKLLATSIRKYFFPHLSV